MKVLYWGCAALCLSLAACDEGKNTQGAALPPPLVSVLELKREDVPIYATFMGQTQGSHSAAVKPQISGILLKRLFEEGARVEKGDALFDIDPAPFKAALEQAEGQLVSAQSRLQNARLENARVQKLYKGNAVSQQSRDNARAAFLSARAEVDSARASVKEARIRLGYCRVDAPFSGWTSREVSTVGSLVSPESTLTFLNQNDPMDVEFAVPSVELFSMRDMEAHGSARSYGQGSPATLHLLEGVEYGEQGMVVFLDTKVEASTSAVRAKARFPNPHGHLLPGQFVTVRVGGASLVDAVMIPQEALVRTGQGMGVYVLDAENRVTLTPVDIGPAFGGKFLVEKGVEAGQRIVVQGQDKISTGSTVSPVLMPYEFHGAPLDADPGAAPSPSSGNVDSAPAPLRFPAQGATDGPAPSADDPQPSESASGKGERP